MAPVSEEEENYVRLALLLKGVTPRAVRTYFDREFPPTYLPSTLNTNYNTLLDLKLRRIINQAQWNLLIPRNGVTDSKTFDVTLMICLIRNLTSITDPINGFDSLPLPGEITPGSDLARIKYYRNKLAHHDSITIEIAYFNTAWRDISNAVHRLGGQTMYQECQELKIKILDQSNQEIILEIKQSLDEVKELRRTMDNLGTKHSKVTEHLRELDESNRLLQNSHSVLEIEHSKVTAILNDPVSWNIRVQIKDELEKWKEDDQTFIQTNAAKHILKYIKENDCVVVTASSGCGKTSLVRHVALQMQNNGFDVLPITNPKDIITWHNPKKKSLFVVDDFCGTYTLNPVRYENWKKCMEMIKLLVEKKHVKLICSCRLQVYNDVKMKTLPFFLSCECNLLSEGLCLSKTEKQSIAEFYLKTKASKIKEYYNMFHCFPLLCQLYSKNTTQNVVTFFKNPFTVYKEEIDKLQTEGATVKYCALALCVMFNNFLKEEWLIDDVHKDIIRIIKNTYEACKVSKGTSRLVIRDELDSLSYTFIRKDVNVYRAIHDKLFDFLAFYFGGVMVHCLINNASSRFIRERFIFDKTWTSDEFTIIVPEIYQQKYIKRMVNDWSKGNIVDVFCNINMGSQFFRDKFLIYINGLEILQQTNLASSTDIHSNSSPLLQSCFVGDIDIVKWCLHHCISNVNICRNFDNVSALYIACGEGLTEVVKILINNKADINQCNRADISPLYIACQNRHTKIVQILINNKADINKSRDMEVSPLFVACQKGHTEVVTILINNKADVNKSTNMGTSPLLVASGKRHIDIIQILINNKADINKCDNKGVSPMYIACEKGNTEVVQVLINNKADIDKCDDKDVSPLYIACEKRCTEVVRLLLNNKADIDKCSVTGASPLLIACLKRHTDLVEMLIDNKADTNKCTNIDVSPLYIACQTGHTEIVQLLIANKADVNKCSDKGASPLYIACQTGHVEVLQMLITYQADINICRDTGGSPLYIASQEGHTGIVHILINSKANINKCMDSGASPLYIACQEGHTEVVQILVNNKADIDKCRNMGASPLYIAIWKGRTDIIKMLINSKADINKCTDEEVSPLYIACQKGYTEVARMLIDNKADIKKCRNMGASPLYIACWKGHTDIAQMLINNKADINNCRDIDASPLYAACWKGHKDVVQMLLNNKADINECRLTGSSPLYIACQKGHVELVQLLINNNADINKCRKTGESPILIACYKGYTEIVELLLKHKADCCMKWRGMTPLDIAERENHTSIVHLFQG